MKKYLLLLVLYISYVFPDGYIYEDIDPSGSTDMYDNNGLNGKYQGLKTSSKYGTIGRKQG